MGSSGRRGNYILRLTSPVSNSTPTPFSTPFLRFHHSPAPAHVATWVALGGHVWLRVHVVHAAWQVTVHSRHQGGMKGYAEVHASWAQIRWQSLSVHVLHIKCAYFANELWRSESEASQGSCKRSKGSRKPQKHTRLGAQMLGICLMFARVALALLSDIWLRNSRGIQL